MWIFIAHYLWWEEEHFMEMCEYECNCKRVCQRKKEVADGVKRLRHGAELQNTHDGRKNESNKVRE